MLVAAELTTLCFGRPHTDPQTDSSSVALASVANNNNLICSREAHTDRENNLSLNDTSLNPFITVPL